MSDLCEIVRQSVILSRKTESGASVGDLLDHAGQAPDLPVIHPFWLDILSMFWRLSASRGVTSAGAMPIQFSEIEAYVRLTGGFVTPDDIDCLQAMDGAFLAAIGERSQYD